MKNNDAKKKYTKEENKEFSKLIKLVISLFIVIYGSMMGVSVLLNLFWPSNWVKMNLEGMINGAASITTSVLLARWIWLRETNSKQEKKERSFLDAQPRFAVFFKHTVTEDNESGLTLMSLVNISNNPCTNVIIGNHVIGYLFPQDIKEDIPVVDIYEENRDNVLSYKTISFPEIHKDETKMPLEIVIVYTDILGNFCNQNFSLVKEAGYTNGFYVINGAPKSINKTEEIELLYKIDEK